MSVSSSPRSAGRLERVALLLALASVISLLVLSQIRGSWSAVAGDESTFLAMAESLATDRDLEFTAADRERLEATGIRPRKAVILQRVEGRIAYSKPTLFPLVASPFHFVLGRFGIAVLNAGAILTALWLFWTTVRDSVERGRWALVIATFAGTGAVLPQVAWSMGDALQLALALAGATLSLAPGEGRGRATVGGVLLGLLVAVRLPNAILAVAVLAALWIGRDGRRAVAAAAGAIVGLTAALALNVALVGSVDPYRAERATFNLATGYPAGEDGERAVQQFVEGRATQRLGLRPQVRPRVSVYSGLYFLNGRHTGLLVYFPIAFVLAGAALRAPSRERLTLLAGVGALAVFYLLWLPENYFGGASFIGNRYFLPGLGLLLPALARPPRPGSLVGVWALSAVVFVSALVSVLDERDRRFSSQSHAHAGIFRLLPYESTALAIEDREDRYYSDEFLRFVDSNAEVGEHGFHLEAGAAPAEILLATPRPSGVLRFLVWADAPGAALVYRDWRGSQRFELDPLQDRSGGLVEIVAASAWRRHPFWWTDGPWRAHAVRLALEAPNGVDSRAELRYLGPYRLDPKFFAYATTEVDIPRQVEAGSRDRLRAVLVNRGRRPWASEADVPIHLARQLGPVDGGGGRLRFTPLPGVVARRDRVELEWEERWPRRPGSYRLELDLAVGGVELFREWLGEPIASVVIEVRAEPSETTAVVSSE